MTQQITLEDVKRLRLQEGDTLVLRVSPTVTMAQIIDLREQMRQSFPDPKTVVLAGDDVELQVVEKAA